MLNSASCGSYAKGFTLRCGLHVSHFNADTLDDPRPCTLLRDISHSYTSSVAHDVHIWLFAPLFHRGTVSLDLFKSVLCCNLVGALKIEAKGADL